MVNLKTIDLSKTLYFHKLFVSPDFAASYGLYSRTHIAHPFIHF